MTSSEVADLVREGGCILGCTIHFAACPDFGNTQPDASCKGCAPAPTASTSTVCSKCVEAIRGLLRSAPDLLGRVRSLSDPMKAQVLTPVKSMSRPVAPPEVSDDERLEVTYVVLANLRDWAHDVWDRGALPYHSQIAGLSTESAFLLARRYSNAILARLDSIISDPQHTLILAEAVLVRHPDVEGERPTWSLADVRARWGVERRDRDRYVFPSAAEEDREISSTPVYEFYDPIITIKQAAKELELTTQAIRKWVASGDLPVAMRTAGPRGSVMICVHVSDVVRVAAVMKEKRRPGRPSTSSETPVAESMPE